MTILILDDVMTGEEVNALVENILTTAEDPYPLGQRSLKTRNDRDASSDRVNSSDVRMTSMVILTDAKQPTDLYCLESCQVGPLGQKFIDLLAEHGKHGKPLACGGKCRSETVRNFCVPDSPLHTLMTLESPSTSAARLISLLRLYCLGILRAEHCSVKELSLH
jgi:hypothetical protein